MHGGGVYRGAVRTWTSRRGSVLIGLLTIFAFGLPCLPSRASTGTAAGLPADPPVPTVAPATPRTIAHPPLGYWLTTAGGAVSAYGKAPALGSVTTGVGAPVVGMATLPAGRGYWLAGSDGGIFAFGTASFLGSMGGHHLTRPVVGIAASPLSSGYWEVASDGGMFSFGVPFFGSTGSIHLNKPVVGMAPTPDGQGYWLVASDGGIFSFGDALFFGSTGSIALNKPIVGMAATPTGNGYWMVASDGGIFAYGDAAFFGSTGALALARPIRGMAPTPSGRGYWLVASDGGLFSFGDAAFFGNAAAQTGGGDVVGMASQPNPGPGKVSIFYYPWYTNPTVSPLQGWGHWVAGGYAPPLSIGSDYYPVRGPYDSVDPATADAQMAEIAAAGVDQIVFSWWGRGSFEDAALAVIVPIAHAHGLDVAIHLEPYFGRNVDTMRPDLANLVGRGFTEFYAYQGTNLAVTEWADLRRQFPSITLFLTGGGADFMRSGQLAGFAAAAGFDGIYTYDPLNFQGTDFASFCAVAREKGLQCAPSVSPGYKATRATGDTRVRPRNGGATYDQTWSGAIAAAPDIVSITSYNEWHEGTQIEPAKPFCISGRSFCYANFTGDYGTAEPQADTAYLSRTLAWVTTLRTSRSASSP